MENFILGACLGLVVGSGVTYVLAVKYTAKKINDVTEMAQKKVDATKEDIYKSVDAFYAEWRRNR